MPRRCRVRAILLLIVLALHHRATEARWGVRSPSSLPTIAGAAKRIHELPRVIAWQLGALSAISKTGSGPHGRASWRYSPRIRLIGGEDLTNPLRFGRQKPNNYCCREHAGPRNQMISRKVRAKLGYMLYQKVPSRKALVARSLLFCATLLFSHRQLRNVRPLSAAPHRACADGYRVGLASLMAGAPVPVHWPPLSSSRAKQPG